MSQTYSIAEARDRFASLVHQVEENGAIRIARRGKVVAVLLSHREFQRLTQPRPDFFKAVSEFRAAYNVSNLGIDPEIFEVRPTDPGREVDL